MSLRKDDVFLQRIQRVNQHTQTLYQNAREVPWQQPYLVATCLEELQTALEELQVAEEELRDQNEAILAAQRATEAERQRYRELFEFAPDGYLVTDRYGVIREANRAAASLLNTNQQYLISKPLINYVPENQRRSFRTMLNQLPGINRVQEWELQLCRRDQSLFEAALTVEVVKDLQGQAIGLRWMIRDITVRKQGEEQMRQVELQNLQLLEADRLKRQFMANMSHELRAPMNAILGFSELLLRRFQQQSDLQLVNMVERIFRNGKHLLSLIEEILDFSKLRAGRLQLELEPFDLVELVNLTVEELRPLAEQKALELRVCSIKSELLVVNDRNRLRQILTNLLSNAIKFTEVGNATVEVHEFPEDRIILTVRDTGMGIDVANQTKVFQEFWQINQTTTRQHGGTGLGLSIVHALVQLMQGSISLESELGQGSTFRVELPRWTSNLPPQG